ncbi:immunoreactive 28 kDa outer membrane protein [Brucella sp. BO2]|uniref:outer membrane protein BP26/OMP28 n=1 Tax=Brucella sp. BO2 TaxID=693750 RepID=UPI0001E44596|nr:outer membrane protein BP26/OMP28 [Brucella sp. BO2]EFM58204.1 immunoreactive 28 kDa outer membrane protein [Brucella sp. BO2]QPN28951.1 outer membrane protein BP26/OMP28 [Brucella sp. BO2]
MNTRASNFLAASFSTIVLVGAFNLPAFAQENQMTTQPARIAVTGEGMMTASPDMAILNLSVLRQAKTAREAMTANNEAMTKVLDAMKKAGIEDRDLQTGGINIQPIYLYPDDKNNLKEPTITGYSVSTSLTVRVRELANVGKILDESVTLGVNQGGDLNLVNDNPSAVINEARKRAVANAIAKAKTLADAAGVGLGRVVEISELSRPPMPMPIARGQFRTMLAAAPDNSVPIAAGENSYNVSVNVVFEIK